QFREEALKLNSEPVAKFIMLKEALEQALALHDFVTAADIVDDLEATFEVGGYALRLRLLNEVAKVSKTKSPEEKAQLIEFALDLAEYAQATESIDDLPKLAVILDELAREINERELKTQKDSKTQKGMRDLKSEVANRSAD